MAIYEFKLPDVGEGVVEGEIVKWLVKKGDAVAEDQPLVEVMTDKATVTIPSPKRGRVLETHGKEGDIAKVHHVLVTLELEGSGPTASPTAAPAATPAIPSPAAAVAAKPTNGSQGHKVLATPVTRRMAREHGIDLAEVGGTGPQGRVTKADVMAMMGPAPATRPVTTVAAKAPELHAALGDQRLPLRGLRKRIAEKMVRSKHTAPHFTFVEEMDCTELVRLRTRINEALAEGNAPKLSFLPLICKALVAVFEKFPTLNANMDEASQELVVRGGYNFGIAAATPEGLTVPVVKDVDKLTLRQLNEEILRLADAARNKRLKVEELSGGTFTITSLGLKGGLFATPIINHPEVAILGIHRMRKRPVVVNDEIVVREMMNLSLSFDHRVIDGSVGADFTYELIRYLERPELLFLERM